MRSNDVVIRDLEIMTGARNYNSWLYSRFDRYLGRRILEVGSGVGNFTAKFLDRDIVVATDVHEPCVDFLKTAFKGKKNVVPLNIDIASPQSGILRDYKPDTIVCINVLEHVKNDRAALANMHHILGKGGRLALLVPAFQSLYGTIDRLVGHHRRYTKRGLGTKLTDAGFTIKDLYYLNSLGVLGWFLNNRLIKRREESPAQVKFYDSAVVPWLSRVERILRPPFGLSLIAVAERKDI